MLVSGTHVFALPGIWSTKGGSKKLFLLILLTVHVHVLEEVIHFFVEQFYCSIDGRLTSEAFINGGFAGVRLCDTSRKWYC